MRYLFFSILQLLNLSSCMAGGVFDSLFYRRTLRVDWILAGNHTTSNAYLSALRQEPYWAGSTRQVIDQTGFGEYRLLLKDSASGAVLYMQGFCTLFQEWQSTAEAQTCQRAFEQVALMPFPKHNAVVVIQQRQPDQSFATLLKVDIDPLSTDIIRDDQPKLEVVDVENHGNADECVDILFLAEGYTATEQLKFIADVKRMCDYLFSFAPYSNHRDRFNIRAVKAISPQAGTDNPLKQQWVQTPFNTSFNSLGIDRYLLTHHLFAVRDYASLAPADQVVVLVNSPLYGGAGIYNHFVVVTSDHRESLPVFAHEFGHAFAALADEYYTSDVSYNNFIDKSTEPWYPNITTLVDFNEKWKQFVPSRTPVPTPETPEWAGKIGVFEGAAYSAKGVYRSSINCRMMNNDAPGFCPVCQMTIEKIIQQHIK